MLVMTPGTVNIRVSDLLKDKGMSVRELVDRTGMSYNTALALSRNASTRIDLDTLARVCDALDVDIDAVLEYVPEE